MSTCLNIVPLLLPSVEEKANHSEGGVARRRQDGKTNFHIQYIVENCFPGQSRLTCRRISLFLYRDCVVVDNRKPSLKLNAFCSGCRSTGRESRPA
jgi:hypothetical protein